jgi:hypothetical protein
MSRAERGALLRPESPQFPPSNAINARLARHNSEDTKVSKPGVGRFGEAYPGSEPNKTPHFRAERGEYSEHLPSTGSRKTGALTTTGPALHQTPRPKAQKKVSFSTLFCRFTGCNQLW